MHFLVIGCGSIGQRHIKNIKRLGHRVTGCETNTARSRRVKNAYGIKMFNGLHEALAGSYDGAFICTPTNSHIPIAIEIAKRGIHLFIEKPLSSNMKDINKLSSIIKKKKLANLIGCNIRFMRAFKFVKKLIEEDRIGKVLSAKIECGFYLPYWHPYEDYRKGYSANRHLGGGAIFDDIHEIDSLCWLFGEVKEAFCFADKLSDLKINTEDIAEIFLKFRSNTVAQVHLDYIQRTYRRYYEFIGEKGVIYFDLIKQRVELYQKKAGRRKVFEKQIKANPDNMYKDEIRHFINCINGKERSINDISKAKEILETALACHESSRKKEIVYL